MIRPSDGGNRTGSEAGRELPPGSSEILSLSSLVPNREQARKHFDPDRLGRLAVSITELGVLEPVIVRPLLGSNRRSADSSSSPRIGGQEPAGGNPQPGEAGAATAPRYEIVAGERRYRAALEAGLTEVPCMVRTECSDADALKLNLVENLLREDLTDLEKSDALCGYRQATGHTWVRIAAEVSLTPNRVKQIAALQRLPDAVKEANRAGRIPGGVARALLPLPLAEQLELLEVATTQKLSAEAVRRLADERRAARGVLRNTHGGKRITHRLLASAELLAHEVGSLSAERKQELLDALLPLVAKLSERSEASNAEA